MGGGGGGQNDMFPPICSFGAPPPPPLIDTSGATFSCGEISAFFAKIFFSVVILNSSLHYQIFEFDTNIIQI